MMKSCVLLSAIEESSDGVRPGTEYITVVGRLQDPCTFKSSSLQSEAYVGAV